MGIVRRLIGLVVVVVLVVGTAVLLLGREWRDWRGSESWATVGSSSFAGSTKSGTVRYEYEINGEKFTGSRVRFFEFPLYNDGRDTGWIQEQRNATSVTIYYDPSSPERAVLVREIEQGRVITAVMSLAVFVGALLAPILFFGFVWRRLLRAFG